MSKISSFKYKAELIFLDVKNNKNVTINSENLKTFIIDHNFYANNMPIMYMTIMLEKSLLDYMILNSETSFIVMTLYKYDEYSNNDLDIECFRKKFVYFLPNDINKKSEIDYNEDGSTDGNNLIKVDMGLICIDNINDNKKTNNIAITNTTMYDYVKYCTSHFKNIVIEPFNYNETFDQLIVPPLDSVSKTLEFLNNYRVFYKTPYRYYVDFNCTYIISSSGKAVLRNSDSFSSVLIDIRNLVDVDSKDPGMEVDKDKGKYKVVVSYIDTSVYDNTINTKRKTKIKGISSTGSTTRSLRNSNPLNTEKYETVRLDNDNENMINNIEFAEGLRNVFITLNKYDLDTDAFTINKKYSIHNIDKYKDKDGDYLLMRKREIYMRDNELYRMNMLLNFVKVPE